MISNLLLKHIDSVENQNLIMLVKENQFSATLYRNSLPKGGKSSQAHVNIGQYNKVIWLNIIINFQARKAYTKQVDVAPQYEASSI